MQTEPSLNRINSNFAFEQFNGLLMKNALIYFTGLFPFY